MESILFGLCLIAVVWLILWVERDVTRATTRWWPFEMKGHVPTKKEAPPHSWRNANRQQRTR